MLIHILGSDIPHHNRTLLQFFTEQIAPEMQAKPIFWVVSRTDFSAEFPALALRLFPNKKAIAKALIEKMSQDRTACLFFHGQFNSWIWLAILFGKIPAKRCAWHIWGADLYETSPRLAFKCFYPLRRLAQKRIENVLGTQGDLAYFCRFSPRSTPLQLYFPTKMPDFSSLAPMQRGLFSPSFCNILLGNSGDPSNRHLVGLSQLARQLGTDLKVQIPMGYPDGNESYITQVEQQAVALFGAENVAVWREKIPFEQYMQRLAECDLGYFPFERQQGIGTLCLLIALNIPFALNRANPFCVDLQQQGVPFLYDDELDADKIAAVRQQLQGLDKAQLAFFPEHYRQQWRNVLSQLCQKCYPNR